MGLIVQGRTINTHPKVGYDEGRFFGQYRCFFSEPRMENTRRQRRYAIIAISLVVVMVFTAVAQSFLPATQTTTVEPTASVAPTVPPPPADLTAITFDQVYVHPSGLYTVQHPTDWAPTRPSNNGTQVQINLENTVQQSVVELYVDIANPPVTNAVELSARFDATALENSWRRYSNWEETGREVDAATNTVNISFTLELRNQTFIARHVAQLREDGWIYVTRAVTPANASQLLTHLIDNGQTAIVPVEAFRTSQVAWSSFFSDPDNLIIRHPSNWFVRDGQAGQPVTIEATGLGTLLVESVDGQTVADADAASAFVLSRRPNAEIVSVEPVERNGASGFAVSFKTVTSEGEVQSGLAVLLNDGEALRTATVRVLNADADLNADDAMESAQQGVRDAVAMLETFNLARGIGLPVTVDEAAPEGESTEG
jgi:hypothetical protein